MKEEILELMEKPNYEPLTKEEIINELNITGVVDIFFLEETLRELVKDYIVYETKKEKYGLLETFNLAVGEIRVNDNRFGFVKVERLGIEVFIKKPNLNTALNGDSVFISFEEDELGYSGSVIRVLNRKNKTFLGIIKRHHGKYFCENIDNKNYFSTIIKKVPRELRVDDIVNAEVIEYFDKPNKDIGISKIHNVIGNYQAPFMDIKSFLLSRGVELNYDEKFIKDINYPDMDKERKKRVDLTNHLLVTIDSERAKDFDDAVEVVKNEDGYTLLVSIADVSSYVKYNSLLDKEALNRGCSIYVPNMVVPMLPFELSDDLCSLKENEERLSFTVEAKYDLNGNLIDSNIYESIMKSHGRLTYYDCNILFRGSSLYGIKMPLDIVNMLQNAKELSDLLYEKRMKNNSLDFETIESICILDNRGKCVDVRVVERGESEAMIEEFMLQANEIVATTLTNLDIPSIYRVHEAIKDDKLVTLEERLAKFDLKIDTRNDLTIKQSLSKIINSKVDNKEIINNLIVRSMPRAKYDINNLHHFGLGLTNYTHFTSPIRRYPDLMVHRLLKQFLLYKEEYIKDFAAMDIELSHICEASNRGEERAQHLEWDVEDMKKAEFMEYYIDEIYSATITGINNHTIFVTLPNGIEGTVEFEELPYDDYQIDVDEGIIDGYSHHFELLDQVKVKLINADKQKRKIEFRILAKEVKDYGKKD